MPSPAALHKPVNLVAGARGNRTHRTQDHYVPTGFEVQGGHQRPIRSHKVGKIIALNEQ